MYSHTVILKLNICRYEHINLLQATARIEVYCKSRGNTVLHEEQQPGTGLAGGCRSGLPTREMLWESCGSVTVLP